MLILILFPKIDTQYVPSLATCTIRENRYSQVNDKISI
jgi:hypothetical protein